MPAQLLALSKRIAYNRVVAGVHYVEDNTEGEALGNKLATFFNHLRSNSVAIQWLYGLAQAEWQQTYP
jgi:hypothetical protein